MFREARNLHGPGGGGLRKGVCTLKVIEHATAAVANGDDLILDQRSVLAGVVV